MFLIAIVLYFLKESVKINVRTTNVLGLGGFQPRVPTGPLHPDYPSFQSWRLKSAQ